MPIFYIVLNVEEKQNVEKSETLFLYSYIYDLPN